MSDCVAANIASYRDSLKGPFPYSEHNGCLPHTGAHVGEAMETPHVDEFMGHYNAIVGTSNYAVVHFSEITGYTAKKKSATRWFSTNDVQELSLLPNAANGNLLKWADKMIDEGICEKTAPKLRAFLLNPTKLKLFMLELTTVVMVGKGLKARNTALEGDTFEFVTGYDTMLHMGEAIKNPVTPELVEAIKKLAIANGATAAAAAAAATAATAATAAAATATAATADDDSDVPAILASLTPAIFKTANVSVDSAFWDWHGVTPPQPRYCGKPTSWVSDEKKQIRIKFEKGRDDAGNPQLDGNGKPLYETTQICDVSKLQSCGLRLEPFDDGAAAPTLSVVPTADTHLLSSSDLSSFNVLLARAKAVASPAAEYFHKSVEGKRGAQLARMRAARLFNPLHVLSSGAVTEADIDALELFRFSKHAKIAPKIQVGLRLEHSSLPTHLAHPPHMLLAQAMKGEIIKYNSLIKAIKPRPERSDANGADTFSLLSFWRANEDEVPAFSYVLRAVLANAPNSIPPERVFSVLNDTFDDDQGNSLADYIELCLQLQFNSRTR